MAAFLLQGAEGGDALRLAVAWSRELCGPIFAAPSVVPDTASVVIADARGLVMAVSAAGASVPPHLSFLSDGNYLTKQPLPMRVEHGFSVHRRGILPGIICECKYLPMCEFAASWQNGGSGVTVLHEELFLLQSV